MRAANALAHSSSQRVHFNRDNNDDAMRMTAPHLDSFMAHLRERLEAEPILARLEALVASATSAAGTRREEVFTREFLCPAIADYFQRHAVALNRSPDEIRSGLGTEGYQKCPGFGFTPASRFKHLFTKSDVIGSEPPARWFSSHNRSLPNFQACPDFAIAHPLPFSIVGETKFIRKTVSPKTALRELYDASRQAVFYLGAFHQAYKEALLVVADASPTHSFVNGIAEEAHPELLQRFGSDTGVYLLLLRIR